MNRFNDCNLFKALSTLNHTLNSWIIIWESKKCLNNYSVFFFKYVRLVGTYLLDLEQSDKYFLK